MNLDSINLFTYILLMLSIGSKPIESYQVSFILIKQIKIKEDLSDQRVILNLIPEFSIDSRNLNMYFQIKSYLSISNFCLFNL